MKRSRFTEEQIIATLREQEAGFAVTELCGKHGLSSPTFYKWKAKYGGLDVRYPAADHTAALSGGGVQSEWRIADVKERRAEQYYARDNDLGFSLNTGIRTAWRLARHGQQGRVNIARIRSRRRTHLERAAERGR
jgi:hypothetical protein